MDDTPINIKENDMSTQPTKAAPILETVTKVHGVDIKAMVEEGILTMVERIDADLARIQPLVASSKALARRAETLHKARKVLIEELDSRDE